MALGGYTQYETVVSVGSFSKILAPGVRAGWVIAHPHVIGRLAGCGLLDSGGGLAPFMSALLYEFVESGALAANVTALRQTYTARRDALEAALQRYVPQCEYTRPEGGFFFWLRLPGVDTAALRPQAQAAGVDFRPGERFSASRSLNDWLRVGFSFYNEAQLAEAARRLGTSLGE
jgi:DNA-binding transcriptional MocR family regulator